MNISGACGGLAGQEALVVAVKEPASQRMKASRRPQDGRSPPGPSPRPLRGESDVTLERLVLAGRAPV